MRKIYTTLLSCGIFAVITNAQNTTIGFNAGAVLSSVKSKVDGETNATKGKIGFTAGIVTDIGLGRNFSIQPALNFVQKGGKETDTYASETVKYTINFNYIEIPVNFLFKTNSAKGRFYVGGGPSIAYGINGKMKVDYNGEKNEEDIKLGSGDDDAYKALDMGINVLTGYQFKKGLFISLNYNMGLSNLFNDDAPDSYLHNRYLGLKIGYTITRTKKK